MEPVAWSLADPVDPGVADVEESAAHARDAGCMPLGRLVATMDDAALRWEKHLPARARDEWHGLVVAPLHLLRTEEADALLEVSPFWRVVSVRALTPLADGSMVETLLAWRETPPWAGNLRHAHRKARLDKEMLRNDTAHGRSVRWVPRGDLADLLVAHRSHVAETAARRGTSPVPVRSLEDGTAILSRCLLHSRRVSNRIGLAISVGTFAVLLFALALTTYADIAWWVPIFSVLWGLLVVYVLTPSWWVFFSYTRWIRPAFPPP